MVKSKKVTCSITGKSTSYTGEYLDKKIQEYGNEENLVKFYICKEAKALFKKGHKIDDVRKILDISIEAEPVSQDIVKYVEKNFYKASMKVSNNTYNALSAITDITYDRSDPDVEIFINKHILKKL
jgi:hypothetical protein